MLKSWLGWINLSLASIATLIFIAALAIALWRTAEIPHFEGPVEERYLPKRDFEFEQAAYDAISSGPLEIKFTPLSIQLPDLRKNLLYYGRNGRPDAQLSSPLLHFSFTGNKAPSSTAPEQRIYIKYDRQQVPPQYVFSQNNAETALWIEVTPQGNQAFVKVGMLDDKGSVIGEPKAHAEFTLTEKEFSRSGGAINNWEIGKLRVDGTLLARQKARWYGMDKFLEKHGGPEYAQLASKQRIDFGEGENTYSIYVGMGDAVIWDGTQWKTKAPGPETIGRPLMSIKKADERLLTFELWDVEGKSKVVLNLLKSTESWIPQNIQQSFKFMGARTRSQFVFEINKERLMLSPQDWLLLSDKGWKKLATPEDIEAYVERKITGPLFIFDGIDRRDDKQFLQGTLFNATRTEAQAMEIPMQQNPKKEDSTNKTPQRPSQDMKKEPPPSAHPSQEVIHGRSAEEPQQ